MHGMGIFRESSQNPAADLPHVYAPVGAHRDLLAYLVRRLLGKRRQFVVCPPAGVSR
jgi:hypothetical protein